MTEAAAVPTPTGPAVLAQNLFVQTWVDSFSQVLAQIGGSAPPVAGRDTAPAEVTQASDQDLWVSGACSGSLRGELSLRIPAGSITALAQILIGGESAAEAPPTAEHREAGLELLRQVAGFVVTAGKSHWGDIQLRLEAAAAAPSWTASSTAWLVIGDPSRALIEMHLSAALGAALRVESPPTEKAASNPSLRSEAPAAKVNLDLLLDVELGVTLRFGSRRLLLREILDLNPGSVVELDRQVEEPVELLLDGRLLAQGEVVVINGNYGLRITDVAPSGNLSSAE